MTKLSKKENKNKDWRLLEFYAPIEESISVGKDFIIKGVAINETITRNGVKYIAEELEKAAPSFRNKPILLDHRAEVKNIVGRTTENVYYNDMTHRIEFEGKVMDKNIQEMIKDGRIKEVSIGAGVQDLIKEEHEGEEYLVAKGLEGYEISFVAVPGDKDANMAMAMAQNYHIKESMKKENEDKEEIKENHNLITKKEVKMVETEEVKKEDSVQAEKEKEELEEKLKKANEIIEEMKESQRQETIKVYETLVSRKGLKAQNTSKMTIETIKALIEMAEEVEEPKAETEVEEEPVVEEPKEVAEPQSEEAPVEEKMTKGKSVFEAGYRVEQSELGGSAFYKTY